MIGIGGGGAKAVSSYGCAAAVAEGGWLRIHLPAITV